MVLGRVIPKLVLLAGTKRNRQEVVRVPTFGLTRLSVWWLKLGIAPHFIRPASPQDNGRHERMHRTLKADTAKPPSADLAEQQARFDVFRAYYNGERPHEALDQQPPSALWTPSPRPMPQRLLEPWYDPDHQVRSVRTNGEIKWNGGLVFLSEPLIGETVGLAETPSGAHIVRFFDIDLGVIDRRGHFRRFAPLRHRLRYAPDDQPQQKVSGIFPVQTVRYHPDCTQDGPVPESHG